MRKRLPALTVLLFAITIFVPLAWAGGGMPPADAGRLWTHMTETSPYAGWGFWPGHTEIYPGKSPHGAFLKLYANPIALKAAREGTPMPVGAIIVKENYGKDKKTLMAVTPMYKVKGYNPAAGDWFWVKYGPNGKVLKAGKPKGCISCHSVKKKNDWIYTKAK